jgi:hypothetical protein
VYRLSRDCHDLSPLLACYLEIDLCWYRTIVLTRCGSEVFRVVRKGNGFVIVKWFLYVHKISQGSIISLEVTSSIGSRVLFMRTICSMSNIIYLQFGGSVAPECTSIFVYLVLNGSLVP